MSDKTEINKFIIKDSVKSPKNRLISIDFVRACSTIGIIIFHYFDDIKISDFYFLYYTKNFSWGSMFVTVFFSISGTVLYHNYSKMYSLRAFYFKRWKSIFPAYYLCFFFFYLKNVFYKKKLFYKRNKISLLFTIFGMDGYFGEFTKTYHLVGGWFLGTIIIIYILFPFMLCILKKNFLILPIILIIIFICQINYYEIGRNHNKNLFNCIFRFYFGILSRKFSLDKNYYVGVISIIIHIILCSFVIPKFKYIIIINNIQGFSLYIILVHIGNYIMKTKLNAIFKEISKLSFFMFLFHHRIIIDMKGLIDSNKLSNPITNIGAIILLTMISSKALYIIVNYLFKSDNFKKLEYIFYNPI
jgi:peptidoglycan/LPS O-acetylase OafA/YrhL